MSPITLRYLGAFQDLADRFHSWWCSWPQWRYVLDAVLRGYQATLLYELAHRLEQLLEQIALLFGVVASLENQRTAIALFPSLPPRKDLVHSLDADLSLLCFLSPEKVTWLVAKTNPMPLTMDLLTVTSESHSGRLKLWKTQAYLTIRTGWSIHYTRCHAAPTNCDWMNPKMRRLSNWSEK
jgi:hypothetical protein